MYPHQPEKHHAVQAGEMRSTAGVDTSNKYLRLLVDQSPDLLWAKDLNGRFLFANQTTCSRLLLTDRTEEPLGKTADFFAERERQRHPKQHDWYTFGHLCADSDKLVLEKRRSFCFDEFGNVGGRFLYLKVNKSPLFDGNGDLLGVVASGRDVTHDRQVQGFRHRLLNGRGLFHAAGAGIGVIRSGVLVYVDQQLSAITGYPVEQLLGSSPDILFTGESAEISGGEGFRGLRAGDGMPLRAQWQRSNGAKFEVLLRTVPINFADPFCGDVSFSVIEVPGKVNLTDENSIKHRELHPVFEIDMPLCLLTPDCTVQYVNQAFCDFFGIRQDEALGQSGSDLWNCFDSGSEHCPLVSFESGSRRVIRNIDTMIRGRHIVGSQYVVPSYSLNGKRSGLMVSFSSKSRQMKGQLDLESARHHLINAESLSTIGSLASTLAHEFNNPLCGVRSVLERVNRKTDLAEPDQMLMELALKECDRMKILVRDLQEFNLASSDTRREFDLNGTIDRVLPLLSKLIKQRKAAVHRKYQGALLFYGVEDQIKQVLLNLLKNSCEAIPETGGIITITTFRQDTIVRLVIQDNGQGINERHHLDLFEPFFTTKSEAKSTGLGLAVSRWIIEGHQGSITVDSKLGKGTTFIINMPIVAASAHGEGK